MPWRTWRTGGAAGTRDGWMSGEAKQRGGFWQGGLGRKPWRALGARQEELREWGKEGGERRWSRSLHRSRSMKCQRENDGEIGAGENGVNFLAMSSPTGGTHPSDSTSNATYHVISVFGKLSVQYRWVFAKKKETWWFFDLGSTNVVVFCNLLYIQQWCTSL